MTFPIDYPAEVRASKARHARIIKEAIAELKASTAKGRPNRGRPKTPSIRNRMILRAYLSDVSAEVLALRYDLTVREIERIVVSERRKLEADDAKAIQADAEKRQAVAVQVAQRTHRRRTGPKRSALLARDIEIARKYAKGTSTKKLAADYGICPRAVQEAVRRGQRAGVEIPADFFQKRRQHVERDAAIYRDACNGKTRAELAERYELSPAYIDELLARERKAAEQGRAA